MKKIICFLTMFFIVVVIANISFANADTIINSMSNVKAGINGIGGSGIGKALNTVIGLLQVAGTGISLVVVTLLGIKYMMAGVGEKAEIKKQATPIVIGCVILFGAVNIMKLIETIAQNILNN